MLLFTLGNYLCSEVYFVSTKATTILIGVVWGIFSHPLDDTNSHARARARTHTTVPNNKQHHCDTKATAAGYIQNTIFILRHYKMLFDTYF